VLVAGPAGSGKTVLSLYTCLNIPQYFASIATAEDPAVGPLPGVNQVSMNDKAGMASVALKAFCGRIGHHHGRRDS
jgi:type IV pilus assembly protein PilB